MNATQSSSEKHETNGLVFPSSTDEKGKNEEKKLSKIHRFQLIEAFLN